MNKYREKGIKRKIFDETDIKYREKGIKGKIFDQTDIKNIEKGIKQIKIYT